MSNEFEKILIIDDVSTNVRLLADVLEPAGYEILVACDGETGLRIAQRARPHLILLDVMMPQMDGLTVCRHLRELTDVDLANTPIIFITALNDRENIVEGFRAGAVDYITKPFHSEEVRVRVRHHLRLHRLSCDLNEKNTLLQHRMIELEQTLQRLAHETQLREQTEQNLQTVGDRLNIFSEREMKHWGIAGFISRSRTMERILSDIRKLHQNATTNVLITGESGTGKELIARAIHFGSPRAKGPFIPVNCVAITAELAESSFFGHTKGSFTGATADRKGFFELADGGTLFLDEIGDMPLGLQAKLLRVLEDGVVRAVGAQKDFHTNVRVLAATNADIESKIAAGSFRQDLYYRLARFHVRLPPLRERSTDIPLLVRHFLTLFATEMGIRAPTIHAHTLDMLTEYAFPGNVRELKNIIERALIQSGGSIILPRHLDLPVKKPALQPSKALSATEENTTEIPLNLREAEKCLVKRALSTSRGNVAKAARLLGVHRARIYRLLPELVAPKA